MPNEIDITRDFKEQVKDRIKSQFASLIPDNSWDSLIDGAMKEFKEKDLPGIVRQVAKEKLIEDIKILLRDPEWSQKYGYNGKMAAGEAITELIKQSSGEILAGLFGGVVQQMVDHLKYNNQW